MACGLVHPAFQAPRQRLTDSLSEQVQIDRGMMTKSAGETNSTQKAKNLRKEVFALCVGALFESNADRRACGFYLQVNACV